MSGAAELTDEVVRAAADGSRADLARVLEALGPRVQFMVAARLSPTPAQLHAAAETAHLVMVALSGGLSRLENRTVSGLKAFVSTIVAHKVSDLLNRRGEGDAVGPVLKSLDSTVIHGSDAGPLWQFLSAGGASPASAADHAEQVTKIMAELGKLKPRHREVITLAFFDQLPVAAIADQMGISRPAASMLLIRAVQTLRQNMTGSNKIIEDDGNTT